MIGLVCRGLMSLARARSEIADLADGDPAGWTFTEYRALHEASGLNVWMANGAMLLYVEFQNRTWTPSYPERVLIYRSLKGRQAVMKGRLEHQLRFAVREAVAKAIGGSP